MGSDPESEEEHPLDEDPLPPPSDDDEGDDVADILFDEEDFAEELEKELFAAAEAVPKPAKVTKCIADKDANKALKKISNRKAPKGPKAPKAPELQPAEVQPDEVQPDEGAGASQDATATFEFF